MKNRQTITDPNGTKYEVTTNNRWRWPVSWSGLTKKEREGFGYLQTENQQMNADFIRAHGMAFHTQELRRTEVPGWDGIYTCHAFSAVLFKFNADGEVCTGRLTC
jgi:hypothetical protein